MPGEFCFAALRVVHDLDEARSALLQLLGIDPVLAVLLVERAAHDSASLDALRGRLGGRRRDLLPILELPPRPWMLRTMRRTDLFALADGGVDRVLDVLRSEDKKIRQVLRHAPRPSSATYTLMADPVLVDAIKPSLLLDPFTDAIDVHLRQVLDLRGRGEIPQKPRRLAARSTLGLLLDHQEPYEPCGLEGAEEWSSPPGDIPLVEPGAPSITLRVIATEENARRLGAEMDNCLADLDEHGYLDDLQDGQAALYEATWQEEGRDNVLAGLRHRVAVMLRLDGCWLVDEAEMAHGVPGPGWVMDRLDNFAWHLPVDPAHFTAEELLLSRFVTAALISGEGWRLHDDGNDPLAVGLRHEVDGRRVRVVYVHKFLDLARVNHIRDVLAKSGEVDAVLAHADRWERPAVRWMEWHMRRHGKPAVVLIDEEEGVVAGPAKEATFVRLLLAAQTSA